MNEVGIVVTLFAILGVLTADGGYIRCPVKDSSPSTTDVAHGEEPVGITNAAQAVTVPLEETFTGPSFEWRDPRDPDGDSIVGVADVDYPILASIPRTNFTCSSEDRVPRYYADSQARCQVFHVCLETGGHVSFLCPNGTMFNEVYSVCDWWYNVDCGGTDATTFTAFTTEIIRPEDEDVDGQASTVANLLGRRPPFSQAHV